MAWILQLLEHVIAGHDADSKWRTSHLGQSSRTGFRTGYRIQATCIRDQFAATARLPVGNQRPEKFEEVAWVTGLWIAMPLLGQNRKRDLGEVVERQIIKVGNLAEKFARRVVAVAPKRLGIRNFQW